MEKTEIQSAVVLEISSIGKGSRSRREEGKKTRKVSLKGYIDHGFLHQRHQKRCGSKNPREQKTAPEGHDSRLSTPLGAACTQAHESLFLNVFSPSCKRHLSSVDFVVGKKENATGLVSKLDFVFSVGTLTKLMAKKNWDLEVCTGQPVKGKKGENCF